MLSNSRPADDITCSMLVVLFSGDGWLLSGGIKVWCVYGVGGDDPGVMKAGSLTTHRLRHPDKLRLLNLVSSL